MFCWLYFIPAFSVKKLKQEVLLDQCCLHLVIWSIDPLEMIPCIPQILWFQKKKS